MAPSWYVTFECSRGLLPKRRSPRETRTFATEGEAKVFARSRLDEGLIVFAGTINPHLPRRHIPSSHVHMWLTEGHEGAADPPPLADND